MGVLHVVIYAAMLHVVIYAAMLHVVIYAAMLHVVIYAAMLHVVMYAAMLHVVIYAAMLHVVIYAAMLHVVIYAAMLHVVIYAAMLHVVIYAAMLGAYKPSPRGRGLEVNKVKKLSKCKDKKRPTKYQPYTEESSDKHFFTFPNRAKASLMAKCVVLGVLVCFSMRNLLQSNDLTK